MTSHLTRPRLSPELHCQQHAMALDSYSYDCCVFPPLLDWEWDWGELDTLGLGGVAEAGGTAVQEQEAVFFPATPGVESPASSEASSGYLQDAVAHWSGRCNKRQRMEATPPPRRPATVGEDLQFLLESFWDSSAEGGGGDGDLRQDLNTTIPETEICCSFVSGDDGSGASGREEQRAPSKQVLPAPAPAARRGGEEAAAVVPPPPRPRFPATVRGAAPLQPRLQKATAGAGTGAPHRAPARRDDRSLPRPVVGCCEPSRAGAGAAAGAAATTAPASACPSLLAGEEKRGVMYPFDVVKPLGLDAGRMTTLDDVNQRILKRPARPVRHPVGPFACGPAVTAHGIGLSGKAVVSLTKIRTGGKGTITIIRTRD